MENMGLESTIVIPTFNRHSFLVRLINYYLNDDSFESFNFVIADSSDKKFLKKNKFFINTLNKKNIKYYQFSNKIDVNKKIYLALEKVKTDFVSICADDDIIFLRSIIQSIYILKNDTQFSSVTGTFINFSVLVNGHISLATEYPSSALTDNYAINRIRDLFISYRSLLYGTHNTSTIKKTFKYLIKNKSLCFSEIFQSTATLIAGKVFDIDNIYGARQSVTEADVHRDDWETLAWFEKNVKNYLENYFQYFQIFLNYLMKEHKLILNKDEINFMHTSHLNFLIPKNNFQQEKKATTILDKFWFKFVSLVNKINNSFINICMFFFQKRHIYFDKNEYKKNFLLTKKICFIKRELNKYQK